MSAVPAFKLVEAGFSQTQVEALAEFMQTEAARRSDLLETEHRLDTRIGEVRAELAVLSERMERRAAETEGRLIKWVIGIGLAGIFTVLGAAWTIISRLPAPMH